MIRVPLLHFLSLFFLVNLFSSIVYAENDKLNIKFLLTNGDWYGAYSGGIKTGHIFNKAELVNALGHQAIKNTIKINVVMKDGDEYYFTKIHYILTFKIESPQSLIHSLQVISRGSSATKKDMLNSNYKEKDTTHINANLIEGNIFRVITTINGIQTERNQVVPNILLENVFAAQILATKNSAIGTKTKKAPVFFDFTDNSIAQGYSEVIGKTSFIKNGKETESFIIKEHDLTEDYKGGIYAFSRISPQGDLLSFDVGGINFRKELEEIATDIDYTELPFIFNDLPLEKPIKDYQLAKSIVFKIRGENLVGSVVKSKNQVIEIISPSEAIVTVTKKPIPSKRETIDLSNYLKETSKYPFNDGFVKQINPISRDSALSDSEKVKKLVNFVYDYIEYEEIDSSTLKDIITLKRGDCTEYAQLFIALARLNSIPAMEVGGLIYNYDDNAPAFSAHAWVEVFIDGDFKQVDPGWNEFDINVTHLEMNDQYIALGLDAKIEVDSVKYYPPNY
jgi:hypothetical protein